MEDYKYKKFKLKNKRCCIGQFITPTSRNLFSGLLDTDPYQFERQILIAIC